MYTFSKYFILFIIYSFIGWLMEVILTLINQKKLVNRGFLIGPCCPIYGFGCLTIIILLNKTGSDILGTFLKSILICSILEYSTSYLMEKIFHAHWWDYSDKKFNINGRICLETMIPFGLGACLVFYIINPFIVKVVTIIDKRLTIIFAITLLIVFIFDTIISCKVVLRLKNSIKALKSDNTEEIKKKIKEIINSSRYYIRIKEAFPNFKTKIKIIEDKIKTITK